MKTSKIAYLVCSNLKGFTNQADREYFSKPVEVEVVGVHPTFRYMKTVRDHARGGVEFLCDRRDLKSLESLTRKQRELAGL